MSVVRVPAQRVDARREVDFWPLPKSPLEAVSAPLLRKTDVERSDQVDPIWSFTGRLPGWCSCVVAFRPSDRPLTEYEEEQKALRKNLERLKAERLAREKASVK
jgi:hypothetical protein